MIRRISLASLAAALVVAASLTQLSESRAASAELRVASGSSNLISGVNALRSSHGLPAYTVSSILMGTAQGQADYMASIGSASHSGPGGSSVTQRLLAAGYPLAGDLSLGGFRSENVIQGPGMTAADAVAAWQGDSIHLHTMLSADLQEIGAGVSEQGGVYYYVIDCARPTTGGLPQAYTPGAESAYSASEIIIPVSVSTPNAKGEMIHEVKPGQSLWQIAIDYGVKIDQIRQLNQLPTTYVINPGDTLIIKTVEPPAPAPFTSTPADTAAPVVTSAASPAATALPVSTATPTPAPPVASPLGAGGAVGAIVLAALAAAGLVAWAGRARQV